MREQTGAGSDCAGKGGRAGGQLAGTEWGPGGRVRNGEWGSGVPTTLTRVVVTLAPKKSCVGPAPDIQHAQASWHARLEEICTNLPFPMPACPSLSLPHACMPSPIPAA
eukprot:357796-Chlamydomonas_euryale.AAC.4